MSDKKYWLFDQTKGETLGLGEVELSLTRKERTDILPLIPHGWRLIESKKGEYTFSRFLSCSSQYPILFWNSSQISSAVMKSKQNKLPEDYSFSGVFKKESSSDSEVKFATIICNLLSIKLGSANCVSYNGVTDNQFGDDFGDEDPRAVEKSLRRRMRNRCKFSSNVLEDVYFHTTVPTIDKVNIHQVSGLVDSCKKHGFPLQPYYGDTYKRNKKVYVALYLSLHVIHTIAKAFHSCNYNDDSSLLWWRTRIDLLKIDQRSTVKDLDCAINGLFHNFPILPSIRTKILKGNFLEKITLLGMVISDSLTPLTSDLLSRLEDSTISCMIRLIEMSRADNDAKYLFHLGNYLQYFYEGLDNHDAFERLLLGIKSTAVSEEQVNVIELDGLEEGVHLNVDYLLLALSGGNYTKAARFFMEYSMDIQTTVFSNLTFNPFIGQKADKEEGIYKIGLWQSIVSDRLLLLLFGNKARADAYREISSSESSDLLGSLLAPEVFWGGAESDEKHKEDMFWL